MHNSFSMLGKIAELTEKLAGNPRSTAFVSLADAYRRMGLLDDALEIAARGTRSLPDYVPGYLALGRIQIQKGDLAGAAQALESALSLEEANLAALKNLARIRLKQGDKNRARVLLGKAAGLVPDDPEIAKLLKAAGAQAAEGSDSGPEAGKTQISTKTDPISTPTLAEIYIRQGFYKKALRIYRDLLKNDPDNTEIRGKLSSLKRRMASGEDPPYPEEPSPAREPAAETDAPVQPEPPALDEPLEIYDKWLGAIQRRRENVR